MIQILGEERKEIEERMYLFCKLCLLGGKAWGNGDSFNNEWVGTGGERDRVHK